MKIEKNFTIGVLSGICGILLIFLITGSTNINTTTKFEFHDLGDTRGVVFNKVNGKLEYKEIRKEPLDNKMMLELGDDDMLKIRLTNWNGGTGSKGGYKENKTKHFD